LEHEEVTFLLPKKQAVLFVGVLMACGKRPTQVLELGVIGPRDWYIELETFDEVVQAAWLGFIAGKTCGYTLNGGVPAGKSTKIL
jgi:hypothetical protein